MNSRLALNPLKIRACSCFSNLGISTLHTRRRKLSTIRCTRLQNSQRTTNQQQLNLSVLRFTLGIPGLNESYLPRWIGYAFGLLLLLNHFVGSNSTTATPSQLGATSMDQTILPEGAKQIFIMSQNISDTLREDLAWGTYILLRNTNTTSVLISIRDALCVRGYWNIPENGSKVHVLDRFEEQIKWIGLSDLKDTLYFPQCADSELWEIIPKGTHSILTQPLLQAPN